MEMTCCIVVGSNDNGSARYWPPGSLHTMGADAQIKKRVWLFMGMTIPCTELILRRILASTSIFDVANKLK